VETLGITVIMPSGAEARDCARAWMDEAPQGINPVEERKAAHAAAAVLAPFTFAELCEPYLRGHADSMPRQAQLRRPAAYSTTWLCRIAVHGRRVRSTRPTSALASTRWRRRRLCKRAGAKGGALIQSNSALAHLKTLFQWSLVMDLIAVDPTQGVLNRAQKIQRDRVLDADELKLAESR
jgi:hypothetical protein